MSMPVSPEQARDILSAYSLAACFSSYFDSGKRRGGGRQSCDRRDGPWRAMCGVTCGGDVRIADDFSLRLIRSKPRDRSRYTDDSRLTARGIGLFSPFDAIPSSGLCTVQCVVRMFEQARSMNTRRPH